MLSECFVSRHAGLKSSSAVSVTGLKATPTTFATRQTVHALWPHHKQLELVGAALRWEDTLVDDLQADESVRAKHLHLLHKRFRRPLPRVNAKVGSPCGGIHGCRKSSTVCINRELVVSRIRFPQVVWGAAADGRSSPTRAAGARGTLVLPERASDGESARAPGAGGSSRRLYPLRLAFAMTDRRVGGRSLIDDYACRAACYVGFNLVEYVCRLRGGHGGLGNPQLEPLLGPLLGEPGLPGLELRMPLAATAEGTALARERERRRPDAEEGRLFGPVLRHLHVLETSIRSFHVHEHSPTCHPRRRADRLGFPRPNQYTWEHEGALLDDVLR